MSKAYDIIVIGGGHNGLTAAITLARENKKVLVLEKRSMLGGIAAGEEFHPGYSTTGLLHDTSGVRNRVIKEFTLEKFGLKTKQGKPTVGLLSKQGDCLPLSNDVEATAAAISKFSAKDAAGYRDYMAFISAIRPFMKNLLDEQPPDLSALGTKQLWGLLKKGLALKRLGKKTMMEFLKVAPMSVADFLNEKFETDFIKAGIAAPALYGSFTGPWSSYTTLNLLMLECLAGEHIIGGPQALIAALEEAAKNAGVDIKTNAPADKIVLDAGRKVSGVKLADGETFTAPVVASSCTPQVTFYDLLQPNQISYALEHAVKHYRSRGTTAKVSLAVNKAVTFNGVGGLEFYRTGNSFDDMERAFDPAKYRQSSAEPLLDIHVPTVSKPNLAPAGHSVISILVHFAPFNLKDGWHDETKKKLFDSVMKTLESYSPGIASSVVGSEVLSPADLESRYSLTNGHIYHGEEAVDQIITRPFPLCAQYATPVSGLYLCGSGSHPGGGITCMPGYLGAQTILKNC
ncbi:MAG: NAD(P)/FAD-dependent oxidoreductase [Cyclobacteriaceae bacterium]|nr:NAD(P)/FAD-dependent oxidoreductase [Cyclobacteriaceae bacterium]